MRIPQLTYLSVLIFIGTGQVEKTPDTDTTATTPTECTVLADNDADGHGDGVADACDVCPNDSPND